MDHSHTDETQRCLRPTDDGHSGGLLLVILLGLGLSIAAGLMSGRVMMRSPQPTAAMAGVPAGANLDVMVQVTAVTDQALEARLLQRHGDAYTVSAVTLHVMLSPDTRFAMGGPADLKPGAVLQLKGIAQGTGGHELQAQQVVVLSGYVQVTP